MIVLLAFVAPLGLLALPLCMQQVESRLDRPGRRRTVGPGGSTPLGSRLGTRSR